MQYPPTLNTAGAVKIPGAWEYSVAPGHYRVTVSVGDMPAYGSLHTIHVEGAVAINAFQSTAAAEYDQATVDVAVSDGHLTIDATGGTNTKLNYVDIDRLDDLAFHPSVIGVSPANGATDVSTAVSIVSQVMLSSAGSGPGIDPATLTAASVHLARTSDGATVPATLALDAGGSGISLKPLAALDANTNYTFTITSELRDRVGFSVVPFSSSFSTGAPPASRHHTRKHQFPTSLVSNSCELDGGHGPRLRRR